MPPTEVEVRRLENRSMRKSVGFFLVLLSVGCNESPTEPIKSVLPFSEVVYRNSSGFNTPLRTVLRSETEWHSFWAVLNENNPSPAPLVDFTRYMLIASARGSAPDGCYRTEMQSVTLRRSVITARIADTHYNGPTCGCPTMVVTPVQVVRVGRTNGPVEFSITNENRNCGM